MTPVISIASWLFLWLININVTLKMSQPIPDVAQPEWMPPRCCSTEVQPRRNQRGDHCRRLKIRKCCFVMKTTSNLPWQTMCWRSNTEVDQKAHYAREWPPEDYQGQMRRYIDEDKSKHLLRQVINQSSWEWWSAQKICFGKQVRLWFWQKCR